VHETPPTALATRSRTAACFKNGGRNDERSTLVFSQMGQNPIGPEGALSVITALSLNERHVMRTLNLKVCTLPVTLQRIIFQDPFHPANDLLDRLPSSRRFRSIETRTSRVSSSLFRLAVQALSIQM